MAEWVTEPCRSCHAPVIWCESERGRAQPVDAEPAEGGYLAVGEPLVAGGSPVARRVPTHLAFGRHDLRKAHHQTCPHGRAWQRRGRRRS